MFKRIALISRNMTQYIPKVTDILTAKRLRSFEALPKMRKKTLNKSQTHIIQNNDTMSMEAASSMERNNFLGMS